MNEHYRVGFRQAVAHGSLVMVCGAVVIVPYCRTHGCAQACGDVASTPWHNLAQGTAIPSSEFGLR